MGHWTPVCHTLGVLLDLSASELQASSHFGVVRLTLCLSPKALGLSVFPLGGELAPKRPLHSRGLSAEGGLMKPWPSLATLFLGHWCSKFAQIYSKAERSPTAAAPSTNSRKENAARKVSQVKRGLSSTAILLFLFNSHRWSSFFTFFAQE